MWTAALLSIQSSAQLAKQSAWWLQVGLKMQFQGSQGQLMFFFGNKGDSLLERLICVVPPSGQFAFQQGPVPSQLEAKKQIQVSFLVSYYTILTAL